MTANTVKRHLASVCTATMIATTTNADITGAFTYDSTVMAQDFGGGEILVFVQDLYFISNDSNDVVRTAFDLLLEPSAQIDYYQAPGGLGWAPSNIGGPFDTDSVRRADSFVTIGGFGDDAKILTHLFPASRPAGSMNPHRHQRAGCTTLRSERWGRSSAASPTPSTEVPRNPPCTSRDSPRPGIRASGHRINPPRS